MKKEDKHTLFFVLIFFTVFFGVMAVLYFFVKNLLILLCGI